MDSDYEKFLDDLAAKWPSTVVARKALPKFTGGVLAAGSAANADSQGRGIPGKFTMCGQACYPVEAVVAWLKKNSSPDWKSRKRQAA